ncbi:MAG TPA: ABC transporter permease [Firmicutes bacterium]|nr:ABC transporter permease [Bacillota bacterium]
MFFRLGFINITRQLGRSLLALISLVLAAVSLTNSLSISLGYPAQAFANYRDYLGGDIIVYPINIMGNPASSEQLELHRLQSDPFSTLTTLYPHLEREGFLASANPILGPFSDTDEQLLLQHEQIKQVNFLYRMPGWRQILGTDRLALSLRAVPQESGLWQYVEGKLQPQDRDDAIPVWLNGRQDPQRPLPEVGSEIYLSVPRIWLAPDGSLQYDSQQTIEQRAIVAGHYELPTRIVSWPSPAGDTFLSEQGYFDQDEVWLKAQDWEYLWQLAAPDCPPASGSLGLQVQDMSILEAVVSELQVAHPQWTIVSVPNLVKQIEAGALLDSFRMAPAEYWTGRQTRAQHAFPLDISRTLATFIYLIAGLLMAARMLTGAAARKKEIGVLKALGARRRDILLMALTEAVVLCLIGSTIGFIIAYPAALFQQLTNNLPWAQIGRLLVNNYSILLAQTLVVGILFGLLPAWRLSKLTVNEVLRS